MPSTERSLRGHGDDERIAPLALEIPIEGSPSIRLGLTLVHARL